MSTFNPNVQDVNTERFVDPKSRSIETPASDKSKGILFSSLGNTFEQTVKSTDQLMEHNAQQETATAQQKEADYELAYKAKEAGVATAQDLLAVSQGPPQQIANYQDQSDLLKQASENGKASSVYFEARQLALAKDLRRRYPGYTDTIDATTAKVTGRNPANALRADLEGMANEAREKKDKLEAQIDSRLLQHPEVPGTYEQFIARKNGMAKSDKDALMAIANAERIKAQQSAYQVQLSIKAQEGNLGEAERKRNADEATRGFASIAADMATNQIVNYSNIGKEDSDRPGTPENARRIIQEHMLDPNKHTDEEATRSTALLVQAKQNLEASLWAFATKPGPDGGPAPIRVMGQDAVSDVIKKTLQPHDEFIQAATNKDYGATTAMVQATKGSQAATGFRMDRDPDLGAKLRIINEIRQKGGDNALSLLFPTWAGAGDLATAPADVIRFTQAEVMLGKRNNPEAKTFSQVQEDLVQANAKPEMFKKLYEVPDHFLTPGAPLDVKKNIADYYYVPSQATAFGRLSLDTKTPDGKRIPGQETMFQRFASPAITSDMKELGKTFPEVWNNYVAWSEGVFREGLIANTKLYDLSKVNLSPGSFISWSTDTNQIKLTKPEIKINDRPITERHVFRGGQTSADQAVVESINKQILPLVHIAKEQGIDVRVLVGTALKGQENNPLFNAIFNAIGATVQKPKPIVEKK